MLETGEELERAVVLELGFELELQLGLETAEEEVLACLPYHHMRDRCNELYNKLRSLLGWCSHQAPETGLMLEWAKETEVEWDFEIPRTPADLLCNRLDILLDSCSRRGRRQIRFREIHLFHCQEILRYLRESHPVRHPVELKVA